MSGCGLLKNMFIYSVLYILVLLFLFVATIFYVSYIISGLRGGAPFVPASQLAIEDVVKEMDLKENSVVYDLGCGDGRVLIEGYKRQPKARYVGIERSLLPFALARFRVWLAGAQDSIEIKKKDFFKEDLSSSTHIYTYLFPEVMDKILPKMEKELKSGTVLLSPTFVFSNKIYDKKVDISPQRGGIIKALFIYRF